jgi:hypothetical protein
LSSIARSRAKNKESRLRANSLAGWWKSFYSALFNSFRSEANSAW